MHSNGTKDGEITIFRKQLFEKIPLEALLEYRMDSDSGLAHPRFYEHSPWLFWSYPIAEMAGFSHSGDISSYLTTGVGSTLRDVASKCERQHQMLDLMKARLKRPFQELPSLNKTYVYAETNSSSNYNLN
jgi:hypothetical protein